ACRRAEQQDFQELLTFFTSLWMIDVKFFMIKLSFPFSEEKIRALKVGDEVLISGIVFTGRDAVHKYLHEGGKLPPEVKLRDGILYHCGPVMMKQDDGSWKCTAAGPTTSIR